MASAVIAFAVTYNLLVPVAEGTKTVSTWTDYLGSLFPILLRFAALAAVVQIVVGGIQYAVGGASPSQMADGRERMVQAILGLLLALTSYLILNTINPDLVSLKLTSLTPISTIGVSNQPANANQVNIKGLGNVPKTNWQEQQKQADGTWMTTDTFPTQQACEQDTKGLSIYRCIQPTP